MRLIPNPKIIKKYDCFLKNKALRLAEGTTDIRLLEAMKKLPFSECGTNIEFQIGKEDKEAYILEIEPEKILIKAEGVRGAFYAIQTLRQLYCAENVPCCYIEDEPDFKYRGFYHDITRGKVPTVETLKRLIDDMAYYKLNSLQLYVEHTYEFKEYADSIDRTGYLTAEEIRELDDYCRMNFIEFIPSLATFGHLYELLIKDRYKHLRELEDFEEKEVFWEDRMLHHTIDPTNEESFAVIKSLLDQYMINFSSDKFNICCDETFDLKIGKHKDEDTGKLYIDFVARIIEYLQSKGKKVMMWADILLNHPEQIEKLPEDVILLNWFYWENPNEDTFKTISKFQRTQIVCPGTGSWNRFCENYDTEIINIPKMAELGYKYGADGVLNTNWGDWGNPCSIELAMFGLVLGAEKSWNVQTEINDGYHLKVNSLVYNNDNACGYIKKLSAISKCASWYDLAKCYACILEGKSFNIEFPETESLIKVVVDCFSIIADVENDEWEDDRFKNQIIISANGIAVMAELLAEQAGYKIDRKTSTKDWLKLYRKAWLKDNKESELCEIEKMFLTIDKNK